MAILLQKMTSTRCTTKTREEKSKLLSSHRRQRKRSEESMSSGSDPSSRCMTRPSTTSSWKNATTNNEANRLIHRTIFSTPTQSRVPAMRRVGTNATRLSLWSSAPSTTTKSWRTKREQFNATASSSGALPSVPMSGCFGTWGSVESVP